MSRVSNLVRYVRARRWLMLLLLVLVSSLLGYLTSILMYPAPLVAREQRVPPVVGMPSEEARRELEAQGFRVRIGSAPEEDPTLPTGYVTWQEPPAWVAVPEGSPVDLTLSAGPAPVTVPDVLEFDLDEARRVLQASGLSLGVLDSVVGVHPPGTVVTTRPATGTALSPGSPVDLVVSRGPADARVPDLLGLTEAQARERLDAAGLRVGLVRRTRPGRAQPGQVVEQRPRPGTVAARGARVDLTVAREQ